MDRTRSGMDGLTDGRTVWLLYASQSSFGGIKSQEITTKAWKIIQHANSRKFIQNSINFKFKSSITFRYQHKFRILLAMESQSQNPELRNNPENFLPCKRQCWPQILLSPWHPGGSAKVGTHAVILSPRIFHYCWLFYLFKTFKINCSNIEIECKLAKNNIYFPNEYDSYHTIWAPADIKLVPIVFQRVNAVL